MKTIIYSLAIITLLLTFVSCNVEDVLDNNQVNLNVTTDIDPPIPMPKPM
ncbi:MAG: hypothetical protein ABI549_04935 [Flavobacterium sp.]